NAHSELQGKRALMLVVDDGWAAAPGWADRQQGMNEAVDEAERLKIPVVLLTTAPPADGGPIAATGMLSAGDARQKIRILEPHPGATDRTAALAALQRLDLKPDVAGNIAVIWLSDGLGGADAASGRKLAEGLQRLGSLSILADPPTRIPALMRPPEAGPSGLTLRVERAAAGAAQTVHPRALDDAGGVVRGDGAISAADKPTATLPLKVPAELRNRIASLSIEGDDSAGGVLLLDDRWRQRPVGLITDSEEENA